MTVLFTILLVWTGLNLLHGAWVGIRRRCWETRFTRDDNGLLPEAAAYSVGGGPAALLFIHGFADTPRVWARMVQHLAEEGLFTCRAMRLPGSAEPAARAKQQSLQLWRACVADEIAHLRQTHERVWLIGHSLGGALALDAALRLPDLVDGVVALAPMIDISRRRSPLLPPRVWFQIARVALCLSPTFESCFSANGAAVDDPSFTYLRDRFIPFAVYRALFELIASNRHAADRLRQPLFLVTAGCDSVVDTLSAERWGTACPGLVEHRNLPEAGHVIPLEIGWQTLCDDITALIRTRIAG